MSTPRFCADLHKKHKRIANYRPLFESMEHNDLYWKYLLESMCTKRDTMYFLGDIIFDKSELEFIKNLPGTKILIAGNHCTEYVHMRDLVTAYDEVHGLLKYKEFWLSHCPLHKDELRGKKNIHGHVHAQSVPDISYLNVSVDSSFMNFKPRTLFEVREGFEIMNETQKHFSGINTYEESISVIKNDKLCYDVYIKALQDSKKKNIFI